MRMQLIFTNETVVSRPSSMYCPFLVVIPNNCCARVSMTRPSPGLDKVYVILLIGHMCPYPSLQALFTSMMKHAADEATLIIPVVSLPTVLTNFGNTWAVWDNTLYQKRWKDRIPVVVVTRAEREDYHEGNFDIVRSMIAEKVWQTSKRCNRVFFCDSLIGLGAMQLERLFSKCIENEDQENPGWKPEYSRTLAASMEDPSSPMSRVPMFRSDCQIRD